jgi:ATP-binding cassette subfamily B protein/subfamily B ATP-binding cassette protein MsbA
MSGPTSHTQLKSKLRMLHYAVPYWRGWIVIVATMLAGVAMNVLKPWPTALLVDQVLGNKPMPPRAAAVLNWLPASAGREGLLLWVTIGTVAIFLLGWIVGTINGWVMLGVGQRMTYDVGADLFLHLQKLSLLFHSRRSVADSINRVNGDTYCVQTLITGVIMPFVQSVVTLLTMFGIMWRLDHKLTLLSLVTIPFMMLAVKLFSGSMWQRTHERRELEGRMMGIIHQALHAIPAVQAFTREELEHDRFRKCADETVAAYQRGMIASMAFNFAVGLVTAIGTAAMTWLGGRYALEGKLSAGTILLFLTYLSYLYGPLNSIMYTASTWQSAAANADRVLEILEIEPDVRNAPNARSVKLHGHVRYENVTFGYDADRPVIHGVSFEAKPGDVIAIVGPTGAGKTTLVNLLMRFFDPWSGRVTVDGYDVRELWIKSLREQVSMVLQEPFIFPYTVAENIAYGRPDAPVEAIESAAVAANADAFIRRLPEGYNAMIGERGATLSGGEKQRLSIARAFVKDAPILVLDEPTSALDARTEAMLLEALDRLMEHRTTFIIAHRLSTIRNADRILVVDQGRIIEQGRHDELMNLGGLYATLYRHQMNIVQHDTPEAAPAADDLAPV